MGPGLGTAHTHDVSVSPGARAAGATRLALASSPGRASLNGTRRTAHRGLACVAVLRALRAPRFRRERLRHHKRHQSECLTSPRNPDTRATHGAPPARGAVGSRPERRSDSERRCAMGATQQRQPSNAWTIGPAPAMEREPSGATRKEGLASLWPPPQPRAQRRVSHSPSLALLFTAPLAYTARSRRTGRSRGRNSNAEPDRARNMTIDILTTLGR